MEQRCGTRKPIDIEAVIDYGAARPLSGRIRDVSIGGVYVELIPRLLSPYQSIRLSFTVERQGARGEYHWRGVVIRVSDAGAGLMFESADPGDQKGMLTLLQLAEYAIAQRG